MAPSSLSAECLRNWSIPASLTHLTLKEAKLHLLDENSTFVVSLPKLKSLRIEVPHVPLQKGIDLSNKVEYLYVDNDLHWISQMAQTLDLDVLSAYFLNEDDHIIDNQA